MVGKHKFMYSLILQILAIWYVVGTEPLPSVLPHGISYDYYV